eukprot:6551140-Pyramimonas_sp.AAC.1
MCVDPCFSRVWLRRLRERSTSRRAHRVLRRLLSVLRVTSTKVERKHLLGQEARKRRGRALQLRTLGATTYAAAIRRDARNLTVRCITECVGEKNVRRYNQVLHAFKTSKNLKGKNPLKRKRRHWGSAFRKKRKVRAYDMFISHNFERGNGEPDAVAAGSSAERL